MIPLWGKGEWARKVSAPLFSTVFQLISPQSHPFHSSDTACDGVVYRTNKFKGGELVQHQPSAKDHQEEGLCPVRRLLRGGIYVYFCLVSYVYGGVVVGEARH